MEVLPLHPDQKKRAAQVVADAFYDYPALTYYFPDDKRRAKWLPWYMERALNCALAFGEVLVTEDVSGVLFALPPGHTRLSVHDFALHGYRLAPFVIGLRRFPTIKACEDYIADTQEKLLDSRPHYYLWGLTVVPAKQRTGCGTALLDAFIIKTDAENVPVYLETHKAQNVPYYEQRGFKLLQQDVIPKHNLDFWSLLHEPGNNR